MLVNGKTEKDTHASYSSITSVITMREDVAGVDSVKFMNWAQVSAESVSDLLSGWCMMDIELICQCLFLNFFEVTE